MISHNFGYCLQLTSSVAKEECKLGKGFTTVLSPPDCAVINDAHEPSREPGAGTWVTMTSSQPTKTLYINLFHDFEIGFTFIVGIFHNAENAPFEKQFIPSMNSVNCWSVFQFNWEFTLLHKGHFS